MDVCKKTASRLMRLLKQCPVCKSDFVNHSYMAIAMTVLGGNESRASELFKAIAERKWEEAMRFQDWKSTCDNVLVYGLRCTTGKIGVVILEDPYDPFYTDRLIGFDLLEQDDGKALETFVDKNKWRPL